MPKVPDTSNAYSPDTNMTLNTHRASGMPEVGENGGSLPITTTNIDVFANGMRVGFVQSFSPSESRNIIKVQELGTEGVVQSVPSNTNGGQISLSRFAVYNSNFYNAVGATRTGKFVRAGDQVAGSASTYDTGSRTFGNPFKTLKDQRVPLEFKIKTRIPSGDSQHTYYVETYTDCWLSSYSKAIAASTITITETATVQYSDVYAAYVSES